MSVGREVAEAVKGAVSGLGGGFMISAEAATPADLLGAAGRHAGEVAA